jgi:hypothetical protein
MKPFAALGRLGANRDDLDDETARVAKEDTDSHLIKSSRAKKMLTEMKISDTVPDSYAKRKSVKRQISFQTFKKLRLIIEHRFDAFLDDVSISAYLDYDQSHIFQLRILESFDAFDKAQRHFQTNPFRKPFEVECKNIASCLSKT